MQGVGVFFNDSSYYSHFGTFSPFFTECEQHIRLRKLSSKKKKKLQKCKYNFQASENQNVKPVILKSITKYCLEIKLCVL